MRFLHLILSLLPVLLTACTAVSTAPPPTSVPLPTLLPTAATLITDTLPLTNTLPLSDTLIATAVPVATVPPTPSPTPVTPDLTFNTPGPNDTLTTGTTLVVQGTATAETEWRLELALLALDGRLLTAVPVPLSAGGTTNWQTELPLPSQITGQATLQANLFHADGSLLSQETTAVTLLPDPHDRRVLFLYQPAAGHTAVPGYYLYFDGESQAPAENLIRLALLDASCQTVLREDSFRVSGSGYWQGFLPIPDDAPAGPACIRAAFGPPNSENRRETLLPITILAPDNPQANRVTLLTNLPDAPLRGGDELLLYGLAYNAPDERIYLNLTLDDGTVLLSDVVETNQYGYWEKPLRIPVGVDGQARLVLFTATAVQTLAETTFILDIQAD